MALVQQAAGTAIEAGLAWRNAGTATEPLPSPAKFQKQEGHGGLSTMPVRRRASEISAGIWTGWRDD